jgi:hypothetical protein
MNRKQSYIEIDQNKVSYNSKKRSISNTHEAPCWMFTSNKDQILPPEKNKMSQVRTPPAKMFLPQLFTNAAPLALKDKSI